MYKQKCKYCKKAIIVEKQQQFALHCRYCKTNSNRKEYKFKCKKCNKLYTLKLTKNNIKKQQYRNHCTIKCANGRNHTIQTRNKISESAKKNNVKFLNMRDKRKCYCCKEIFRVISSSKQKTCKKAKCISKFLSDNSKNKKCGGQTSRKTFYYNNINGEKFCLHSSYELMLAKDLNKNNILWIRPKPFKWIDKNNQYHYYYPDFEIIGYKVYVDTKNDYLIKIDNDKIKRVRTQNNINLIILDKNNLSWNNLSKLIK